MMAELIRTLNFTVKEQPYSMNFPTIGEYLRIESKRIRLSDDTYAQLVMSRMLSSAKAVDIIDMISIFTVLCPNLVGDLKTKNILDLDIIDAQELITLWNLNIKPWVESWMALFVDSPAEEVKKTDTPDATTNENDETK